MTTRLSKIARLPAKIREQLNHRLHDGELSRTILPWVNNLPKTKKIMAELFAGKPITHQNLSEWRATGYQDWLFHQNRLQWFSRLEEEDQETSQHDGCSDTYEAMSRFFLFEIGQAMRDAQKIKNPDARWERMERLTDKFARLQNAYNWSRRVGLEYDKYNHQFKPDTDDADDTIEEQIENSPKPVARIESFNLNKSETFSPSPPQKEEKAGMRRPQGSGGNSLDVGRSAFDVRCSQVHNEVALRVQGEARQDLSTENQPDQPERQGSAALQDAPHNSEAENPRASVLDCGSPLPLSDVNSSTPKLLNSQTPNCPLPLSNEELQTVAGDSITTAPEPEKLETRNSKPETLPNSYLQTPPPNCQPIPTLAPTPQPPNPNSSTPQLLNSLTPQQPPTWKTHKVHSIPIRGRRFTCIEG